MSRLRLRLLAATLAVLVIAACSQPAEQQPTGPQGTVHTPSGAPTMLGVTLFFIDFDSAATLSPATVVEAGEGIYVGPITTIAEDGSFTLELPEGSDLPAALMGSAEDFVHSFSMVASCDLVASDPTVNVTKTVFELVTIPGIALLSIDGLMIAVGTAEQLPDAPTSEELYAARFQTWVYADGPTTVVTDPAVCEDPDLTLSVDVSLTAGWNQLEWTIVVDELGVPTGIELGNSTAEELHVLPLGGF